MTSDLLESHTNIHICISLKFQLGSLSLILASTLYKKIKFSFKDFFSKCDQIQIAVKGFIS